MTTHYATTNCDHTWNETTSNGDKYRFFVCAHCDSTKNYIPFEDDHTDSCTDIRNHLSPNTVVLENNLQEQFQEANEAECGR